MLFQESRDRCARCGQPFECGMRQAGAKPCWCASHPPLAPDARWSTCLCARCLEVLATAQAADDADRQRT